MATKDITDAQVCAAYTRSNPLYSSTDEELMAVTGQCEKVCYSAMARAERRGLIEYGVSLRSGWLTTKGQLLAKESLKNNANKTQPHAAATEAPDQSRPAA